MGARVIEINAGDRLLKDYKDRTSSPSRMQVPTNKASKSTNKGPQSPNGYPTP